jgi:hypothetical protein
MAPSLTDLRRLFYGAASNESVADAEYRSLLEYSANGVDAGAIAEVVGVVNHQWAIDGTTGWTQQVISAHGPQTQALSVVSGRGRMTAGAATEGNFRAAYLRDGTSWENSEMESLIGDPDLFQAGDLAQWGHLHRVQEDAVTPGLFHAFAILTDASILSPHILRLIVITYDGVNLNLGSEELLMDVLDAADRRLVIRRAVRAGNVVTLHFSEPWTRGYRVGDLITVAANTDATFNIASAALTGVNTMRNTLTYAQVVANATDEVAGGLVTATLQSQAKYAVPFKLATRLDGNTVRAMQWRPEDAKPDWGDPSRVATRVFAAGTIPPHSGVGSCGLFAGHLDSSHFLTYGDTLMSPT